jgi:flagellar hook-associated protein 3 FlgL
MRISSSQFFSMNVQTMDDQQSSLAQMYQQIASGKKLQTASDDPLGAAQAVQLTTQATMLTQYGLNQASAITSLQQEFSTLSGVTTAIQGVQSQITHAGDGTLNDADRANIASTIQGLRTTLMTLANTTDSSGNYIFAGFAGSTQAFTDNPSGTGATYNGDAGQRQVQISDNRTIDVSDLGSTVFQGISPTESDPVPAAASANTGSGTIGAVNVNDASNPGNASTYQIAFTVTGGTTSYSVTDKSGNVVVPSTPYTAGSKISFAGESVAIGGAPADGDSFSVTPANSGNPADTDVFTTLDNLMAALNTPSNSSTSSTALTNALATASTKINNMYNNVLAVQVAVGGRTSEVTATQTSMATTETQTASSLNDLTSIDMVSAISQYEMTQTALKGAQQAFTQVSQLSLFNYLNN